LSIEAFTRVIQEASRRRLYGNCDCAVHRFCGLNFPPVKDGL